MTPGPDRAASEPLPLPPPVPLPPPDPRQILTPTATGSSPAVAGSPPIDHDVPTRRLHPLSFVASVGVALLRSWPIVLLALARARWPLLLVLAAVLVIWRGIVWLRTTYSVDDSGLVVRSGLLWRSTQVVPPQRVQQVELRRALRHRVLGLSVVRVGLAGGGDTTQVALDALSVADADRLGATLEHWRATRTTGALGETPHTADRQPCAMPAPPAVPTPPAPERLLLTIGPGQLVVAGLTSRSLWLAPLAAFAAFVQLVSDARLEAESTETIRSAIRDASPAVLIAVVMVLSLGAAAVGTVVRHFGLRVVGQGDEVRVTRGLLEQRSVTVPRSRVQFVEVTSHVLRRALGVAAMEIRTADLGGSAGAGETSTSIPIGRREDVDRLVGELLPHATLGEGRRHPAAAVRRAIVRRTVRLVPLAMLVGLLIGGPDVLPFAAVGGVVVAVPTGWATGRSLRSGWTASAVVVERGAISWRRWIVPVNRIQSVGVVQDPFQRRLGLASVRLDVAGAVGGVVVRDLGHDRAWELARQLGLRSAESPLEP